MPRNIGIIAKVSGRATCGPLWATEQKRPGHSKMPLGAIDYKHRILEVAKCTGP